MSLIKAEETTLLMNAGSKGQTKIIYDGEHNPAVVFQRKLGGLWKGPLNLRQMAIDEGKTSTQVNDAKFFGDFKSELLSPGEIVQYGILPTGFPENFSPKGISDDRFEQLATVVAMLKTPRPTNFINDENEDTGGTYRYRQINTTPTDTAMVFKIGRRGQGLAVQDPTSGLWRLTKTGQTLVSGWGTNHELEATPVSPGNIYASTILLVDKAGNWQSWSEHFSTLERTVTLELVELHVVNDGDSLATSRAGFRLEVHEGQAITTTFIVAERQVDDGGDYDLTSENYVAAMGPKQINEDNHDVAVSVWGYDEDGIEANEHAASGLIPLVVPAGKGRETVTDAITWLHAVPREGDLEFKARVKHSVKYTL
jgi:hypothetical protein